MTPRPTADDLRAARRDLDLTQAEAARAYGVGYRTYQRWESGQQDIPVTVAAAIREMRAAPRPSTAAGTKN